MATMWFSFNSYMLADSSRSHSDAIQRMVPLLSFIYFSFSYTKHFAAFLTSLEPAHVIRHARSVSVSSREPWFSALVSFDSGKSSLINSIRKALEPSQYAVEHKDGKIDEFDLALIGDHSVEDGTKKKKVVQRW